MMPPLSNIVLALQYMLHTTYGAPSRQLRPRLDNGLALTPPMGWNSYNHYNCYPNETIMRSNAQALVDLGLADLGYYYVTTDCGWASDNRTANGSLTWIPSLFPSGFPQLGAFIHSLGLGFGVYSDSGIEMCGGIGNGSLYHETQDADTFASWGADLLKYDNCYSDAATGYPNVNDSPSTSPSGRMAIMTQALAQTGRKIAFSICEWGVDFPSLWAPELGNTWRVTNDIIPSWSTIFRIMNQFVPSASYAAPGQWPDLDMLEVGNDVFTTTEEQTHFSLWAIAKSPLVIGGRLHDAAGSIKSSSLAILSNKAVIGYNQDSLGVAAHLSRRYTTEGLDVWSGPLSNGRTVVALVNWNDNSVSGATLNFPDIGIQSAGSVYDVWNDKKSTNVKTSYSSTIPAHGVLLMELGNTTAAGAYSASTFATRSSSNTVFSNIYGITNSASYSLTIHFSQAYTSKGQITVKSSASSKTSSTTIASGSTSVTLTIPLAASPSNTLTITSSGSISSIQVTNPSLTLYPSTSFTLSGGSTLSACSSGTCLPVGSKVGYLSTTGAATISIPQTTTSSTTKYVEIIYTNNDLTQDTWTNGRMSRNVTIAVNGNTPVRLEVPISGNSSELYSPGLGWYDSATLGLLVSGFGTSTTGKDTIVISNVNGAAGIQTYAPDFVGLRVMG